MNHGGPMSRYAQPWKNQRKKPTPVDPAPTVPCCIAECPGRVVVRNNVRGPCESEVCQRLAAAFKAQAKRLGKAPRTREYSVVMTDR